MDRSIERKHAPKRVVQTLPDSYGNPGIPEYGAGCGHSHFSHGRSSVKIVDGDDEDDAEDRVDEVDNLAEKTTSINI